MEYKILKKDRCFYTLVRLFEAVEEKVSAEELCNLCRGCLLFTQSKKCNPHDWKAWWKMALNLLGYDSLGLTKWFGLVGQRTRRLPSSQSIMTLECEILAEDQKLGIMFNMTDDYKILYVSPMIISQSAYRPTILDVANQKCQHWIMLYINKDHWLKYTIEYYINHITLSMLPERIATFLASNQRSEKHAFICQDMLILQSLLKLN